MFRAPWFSGAPVVGVPEVEEYHILTTSTRTTDLNTLWERFHAVRDENAREGLVLAYLGLVKYVAGRLAIGLPSFVEVEDLFGAGLLGLMQALDKFDVERQIKFETYAIPRIRGSMLDELRTQDWFPRSIRRKAKQLERAYAHVESRLERTATDEEIARHLKISMDQYYTLVDEVCLTTLVSLDKEVTSAGEGLYAVIETVANRDAPDPADELEDAEMRALIRDVVESLPEKERTVLNLYYYEELTLKEIGDVLGISESRVCQIHTKSVLRVKGRMHQILNGIPLHALGAQLRRARQRPNSSQTIPSVTATKEGADATGEHPARTLTGSRTPGQ